MRCSNCKADNPDGLKFCNECGAALKRSCAKCGFENFAAAKFCGQCAAKLEDPASRSETPADAGAPAQFGNSSIADQTIDGERKMVTALFADIKGSTELMADLDPEDARAIIDPALQIMIRAVRSYEGYVVQSTGDGIYAVFGAPIAYEDHPQRGVYAALEMQKKLREHADRLAKLGKPTIEVRIGINSGELVMRAVETGGRLEYTSIGHSANLAARLQTLAPDGSIAVSERTRRLVEGYFELRPLGTATVKGISDPIDAYEVVGLGTLRRFQVSKQRGLNNFVGRDGELRRMRRPLERAMRGEGQIVASVSDAGAGKSRLLFEFSRTLPPECRVLEAHSMSHGKAMAWLPVIELLYGYFGITDADDAAARRRKVSASLAALDPALDASLPYLLGLLGVIEGPDPLEMMDPRIKRQRTLEGIRQIILAESVRQPVVIVFEDLHWIDEQTQALLDLVADSIASARVLLLVTYRPEYRHNWAAKSHYLEHRLEPLTGDDAENLLSALLGDAAELRPLKSLIIDRTNGNPFFIEETIRALFEEGALLRTGPIALVKPLSELRMPATVQGILAERIDRLSAKQKELLQTLAVIGRKSPIGLVREVASGIKSHLDPIVLELESAEFIYRQQGSVENDYIFKHALTQEVAYNSLLIERRKLLHERVGQALESKLDDKVGDALSHVAHHYSRSDNIGKAVEYLGRAGQQAIQRSAHGEAITNLRTALRHVESLPDSPERARQEAPLQLALGVSVQTTKGYASDDAVRAYGRARELSERIGDDFQLVAALRGESTCHNVRADYKTAVRLGQRLLSIGRGNFEHLIEGRTIMGQVLIYLGEFRSSEAHFLEGLALEAPDGPLKTFQYAGHSRAVCLAYLARTLSILGYPDRALEYSNEAVSLARTLSMPITLAQAQGMHGLLYQVRREIDLAEEWADKNIAYATAQGFPYWWTLGSILKGWLLDQRGESELGFRMYEKGLQGYRATGARLGLSWLLGLRGELLARIGRIDDGLVAIDEALAHIAETDERYYEAEAHRLKAELLLLRGGPGAVTAAELSFQKSLAVARGQQAKAWELRAATGLARLRLRQGRSPEGLKILSDVYDWFTEGFDTPDLKDARHLLDELNPDFSLRPGMRAR
jgi:class 3 adenylate cyclase/predicted ATPase